jgi:hypothetical protein
MGYKMKVIFYTEELEDNFEVTIKNLMQLYDYLKVNKPKVFEEVSKKELCYTVYDESKEKAYPILPTMLDFDISGYGFLVICPKLEGEAFFSTIAMATTAAIAGTAMTAAATTVAAAGLGAVIAGYVVATIVTVGIIIALGMLIKALSPQNKLSANQDPSEVSKLFNGVPNITEQGGSVPVVFGNCLYGGVRIGLRFEVALDNYTDVAIVNSFAEIAGLPSTWLKLA